MIVTVLKLCTQHCTDLDRDKLFDSAGYVQRNFSEYSNVIVMPPSKYEVLQKISVVDDLERAKSGR